MSGLLLLGVTVVFLWVAISTALKGNARNPVDALQHVSGFTVSVALILALLVFALPYTVEYLAKDALPTFWGPVFTEAWDDAGEAGLTVADIMNRRGGIPRPEFVSAEHIPTPSVAQSIVTNPVAPVVAVAADPVVVQNSILHTVVAGDTLKKISDQYGVSVDEIVGLNGVTNRNSIEIGQTLVIQEEITVVPTAAPVVAPTLPPVPTPTPMRDWSIEFNTIEVAKVKGDIEAGVSIINTILRSEPDNVVARTYQQEIQLAYDVITDWEGITYDINITTPQSEVESLLTGFEFRVKSIEDGFNVKSKREEAMVLTCISPNWLSGREVTISRYMGERMGFYGVGDILIVGG